MVPKKTKPLMLALLPFFSGFSLGCGQANTGREAPSVSQAQAKGQSVQGEVQGRIAVDLGKDGYALFDGQDIERIDDHGILLAAKATVLSCTAPKRPMHPLTVIDALAASPPSGIGSISVGGEMLFVVRGYSGEAALHAGRVLGEYEQSGEKTRIAPSLRLLAQGGVVSVPLRNLGLFTKSSVKGAK